MIGLEQWYGVERSNINRVITINAETQAFDTAEDLQKSEGLECGTAENQNMLLSK